MSSTADWNKTIERFRKTTQMKMVIAPRVLALELWEALVDATPVLSGLTRANWVFAEGAQPHGPAVTLDYDEYRLRQKEDNPLPRPDRPTVSGVPRAGSTYWIVNATVDPVGHQYLFHILNGTKSRPGPWFAMTLEEIKFRAPELLMVVATKEAVAF